MLRRRNTVRPAAVAQPFAGDRARASRSHTQHNQRLRLATSIALAGSNECRSSKTCLISASAARRAPTMLARALSEACFLARQTTRDLRPDTHVLWERTTHSTFRTTLEVETICLSYCPSSLAAPGLGPRSALLEAGRTKVFRGSPTCGRRDRPCRSISQAITSATAGDLVLVGPGRYGDLRSRAAAQFGY